MNFATISKNKLLRGSDISPDNIGLLDIIVGAESLRDTFLEFMSVFLEFDDIEYGNKTRSFYLTHEKTIGVLSNSNIDEFFDVFKMAYCISDIKKESDRDDIDDEMRQLLLEFEDEEEKIKNIKGNIITINSMIKAVCCKHPSLNCLNIGKCTLYQIKTDLARLYQIDSSVCIHTGIYTGNIDSKNINLEEYSWAK